MPIPVRMPRARPVLALVWLCLPASARAQDTRPSVRLVPLAEHAVDGVPRVAAFSADGHWLATGGEAGDVIVWDLERRRPKGRIVRFGAIAGLALDAGGEHVAVQSGDLSCWRVREGDCIGSFRVEAPGPCAYARDGRFLAWVAGPSRIVLANGWRRVPLKDLEVEDAAAARELAFTDDGDTLLVTDRAGRRRRVDRASGRVEDDTGAPAARAPGVLAADPGRAREVAAAPDGTVWLVEGGRRVLELREHRVAICGLEFTADRKHLVVRADRILVADLVKKTLLSIHADGACAAGPTGADVWVAGEQSIVVHHGADVRPVRTQKLTPAVRLVGMGGISRDGRHLLAREAAGPLVLVDLEDGTWETLGARDGRGDLGVTSRWLQWSPDGKHAVAQWHDNGCCCWPIVREGGGIEAGAARLGSFGFAFSRDGKLLVQCERDAGELRDAQTGVLIARLPEYVGWWGFLDGGLALAHDDAAVKLWDVERKQPVAELWRAPSEIRLAALADDGSCLAVAVDGRLFAFAVERSR